MEKKGNKITVHYKIANASAIIAVLFLGAAFIVNSMLLNTEVPTGQIGMSMAVTLIILMSTFVASSDFSQQAFFTPLVLFIFYSILMIMSNGKSSYYLYACLCFCGISCLYADFHKTVGYVITQNLAIGTMIFIGIPIIGNGIPLFTVLCTWLIYLFCVMVLLLLTRAGTIVLGEALEDQNYFKNLLTVTANYIAMVDDSNRVVYVSKPLSQMIDFEDQNLAEGQLFVDLFPIRELKLLAGNMLRQKTGYEGDWEFTLGGQKRFFRVVSNDVAGTSKNALINMYDLTSLAERDEIAIMKDSLKIGLFFMDRDLIIQDHYSRYLEDLLSLKDIAGRRFTDILAGSVSSKEIDGIIDYLGMIINQTYDQSTLEEINPLAEFQYSSGEDEDKKVFNCNFVSVDRGGAGVFILVSIYDISARVELQHRLMEEENRRQEEMQSIFELIQVEHDVFNDFLDDTNYEFERIDNTLKNGDLYANEVLVDIYQSVHAIKSNAVILGLNTFGNKAHELESRIKELLQEGDEIPFSDMLHLVMEIEKLSQEKEGFWANIKKIQAFGIGTEKKQGEHVLIESLKKTADKSAEGMDKKVQFVVDNIDTDAIEKGPRRVIKEILIQLIRNSVVHGIELPEERLAKGKDETGTVRLSINIQNGNIHLKLSDDGRGLDFVRIRNRAKELQMIKDDEGNNKNTLLKVIFMPGFSTAVAEGVHAGRGVGLSFVRDRVRDVKGAIKLQSDQDKGTVFNISIPMGDNSAQKAS